MTTVSSKLFDEVKKEKEYYKRKCEEYQKKIIELQKVIAMR